MIESQPVLDQLGDDELRAEIAKLIPQGMTVTEFLDRITDTEGEAVFTVVEARLVDIADAIEQLETSADQESLKDMFNELYGVLEGL